MDDGPDGHKVVTFLYKLAPGECPKSYGLNVARLARLPLGVIDRAKKKSEEFEAAVLSAEIQSLLARSGESGGSTRPPNGSPSSSAGGKSGSGEHDASGFDTESANGVSAGGGMPALDDEAKMVALFRHAKRLFGGPAGGDSDDDDAMGSNLGYEGSVSLPPGQLEAAAVGLLQAAQLVATGSSA